MDGRVSELERLYREAGPGLMRFISRRLRTREDAEDALQATFVEAARHYERMVEAGSPRAWLYAVARNLVAARQRRAGIVRWSVLPEDPPAKIAVDSDVRLDVMRDAMGRLPESLREILELRIGGDLSYQEIADALGLPVGTVRSRIHRAVEQLRTRLACRTEE